jgi:hypothetical protein
MYENNSPANDSKNDERIISSWKGMDDAFDIPRYLLC